MDEYDDTHEKVLDLPEEAIEWLHRALQWPEDLAEYDRVPKITNLTEMSEFF